MHKVTVFGIIKSNFITKKELILAAYCLLVYQMCVKGINVVC